MPMATPRVNIVEQHLISFQYLYEYSKWEKVISKNRKKKEKKRKIKKTKNKSFVKGLEKN